MNEDLETLLNHVYDAANDLTKALRKYQDDLWIGKPLEEMGLSDKVKVAKFIVNIKKKL